MDEPQRPVLPHLAMSGKLRLERSAILSFVALGRHGITFDENTALGRTVPVLVDGSGSVTGFVHTMADRAVVRLDRNGRLSAAAGKTRDRLTFDPKRKQDTRRR